MLFSTYIQKLHNTIEQPKPRGIFTEMILKVIVTDHTIIDGYTAFIRNCENYYDGKTKGKGQDRRLIGDTIRGFAINAKGYLDGEKLTSYLRGLTLDDDIKTELCESFRSEVPEINNDNYPEKLSQLLIQIIQDTTKKGRNTQNMPSDPSNTGSGSKADSVTINRKSIERIKAILEEISVLYRRLDIIAFRQYERLMNNADSLLVPLGELKPDEEDQNDPELMKLREEFDTKNALLLLYQESIPEVKRDIEEIVLESKCLRFQYIPYYISDNDPLTSIGCEYVSAKGEHEN